VRQSWLSASLVSEDVVLAFNSTASCGREAVLDHLDKYLSIFPDLILHDEEFVVDGRWVAILFCVHGTRGGDCKFTGNERAVRALGMRFLEFGDERIERGVECVSWVECLNEGDLGLRGG
jgi:hypothetical protein